MDDFDLTYPGGLTAMSDRWASRRAAFVFYKESLPPLDADLAAMARETVAQTATTWQPGEPKKNSTWARKRRDIATEFVGASQLSYLNAMLIANLRREAFPVGTEKLFIRLWAEQSDHLIKTLSMRWKVSSIITFADHGANDVQRQVGQALRMLFGMMKLYEFERLYGGIEPAHPWAFGKKKKSKLPMDMEHFSLKSGGLDISLLVPVWEMAASDPVIAPLACHLMEALNQDAGTVFRRLAVMRDVRATLKAIT